MNKKVGAAKKVGRKVARKRKSGTRRSRSIRTFNLEDEIYFQFRSVCALQGEKMSSIIDDLIEGYLSEFRDKK